jgi:6-phosphofructokinase 1
MGRDAGFIAVAATLASQEVNFCLIPEVPFVLAGEKGFLEVLRRRLQSAHHAVVAVAEGAGQELIKELPPETDASGNRRYADIGVYLREQIVKHFRRAEIPADVKYFDPKRDPRNIWVMSLMPSALIFRDGFWSSRSARVEPPKLLLGLYTWPTVDQFLAISGQRAICTSCRYLTNLKSCVPLEECVVLSGI